MMNPTFIPKKIIILLHEELVDRYGGSTGLRDLNLLESALEQPKITFDGVYLHDSIFKMAAAYDFHLCRNHPFVDGNKTNCTCRDGCLFTKKRLRDDCI